jgi:hypothetical protein
VVEIEAIAEARGLIEAAPTPVNASVEVKSAPGVI